MRPGKTARFSRGGNQMRPSGARDRVWPAADRRGYSRAPDHQPVGLRRGHDAGKDHRRPRKDAAETILGGDQRAARPLRKTRLYGHRAQMLDLRVVAEMPAGRRHQPSLKGTKTPGMTTSRIIGVTLGDPAGIGPEVALAALASGQLDPGFRYEVIGAATGKSVPGQPSAATARAAWDSLEMAATRALSGEFAAVVTAPVCKAGLYKIGFSHPGQTEFFAARCGVENFAMLLTGGALTVALVSTHLPLADAVRQLSTGEIVRVGCLLVDFLRVRLGRTVRVAVAGLNPHAGEQGTLGREEIERIEPAVSELQRIHADDDVTFNGPVPPDTVFHQAVARSVGRRLVHVPRPGVDPVETPRVRRRGERDPRTADHSHQPGSRHGVQPGGHGSCASREHGGRFATRGRTGEASRVNFHR